MNLALPLRMLGRDWRAGELRILALALVIAVASVTSVAFFADRVRQALLREAHQLLGADVVLTADHPWRTEIRDEIARRGLKLAENTTFISMARLGEQSQLVGVKAVTDGYPLRGNLRTAPAPNEPDARAEGVPPPGTVWIDERLAPALQAKVGDRIELGEAELTVAAILTLEPDRSVNFFNIAPRLMMNRADVEKTKLIQSGSRAWYHLLAAGEREAVGSLRSVGRPAARPRRIAAEPRERAARDPRRDRARAEVHRPHRAARGDPRGGRRVARDAPLHPAAPRRLRGDALPRRDAGTAHAPLRVGVRGARRRGLRRGLRRRLSRPARDRRIRLRTDDRRAAAAVAPAGGRRAFSPGWRCCSGLPCRRSSSSRTSRRCA